jgi:hypothetical protein
MKKNFLKGLCIIIVSVIITMAFVKMNFYFDKMDRIIIILSVLGSAFLYKVYLQDNDVS